MDLDDMDLDDFDDDAAEDLDDLDADAGRGGRGGKGKPFRVFSVIRKTQFDYSFLAATSSSTITLRRAIALPAHYWYWFGVRLHNRTIGTGNFRVAFYETLPSSADPQEFTAAAAFQTITMTSADNPPSLLVATDSFRAPFCKAAFTATQAGVSGQALYAELSVVLFARAH